MMLSSVKAFHICVIFYPASIVDHARDKVPSLSQDQALQSSENNRDKTLFRLWLNTIPLYLR